ncbi:MAG: potassium channel family protein [Pseudomonadota bacterium]
MRPCKQLKKKKAVDDSIRAGKVIQPDRKRDIGRKAIETEQRYQDTCDLFTKSEGIIRSTVFKVTGVSSDTDECQSHKGGKQPEADCYAVDVTVRKDLYKSREGRTSAELDLLDYIYFSVYTITTTGYGDIIPITPWAQFLTIVANLFELTFMVIFFNVVFNSRINAYKKEALGYRQIAKIVCSKRKASRRKN